MISRIMDFLLHGIWRIRIDRLPRMKSFGVQQLRVLVLSVRGFIADKCYLRASALTYYCILSVVPVAALAFGIAKGFGFAGLLEEKVTAALPGQEDVAKWIMQFANSMLEKTKGGLIAGLGVAVLFWTTISLLGQIESAFNAIWGVGRDRSFLRKFTDYISIVVVCPVLFILAGTVNVFLGGFWDDFATKVALAGYFTPLIHVLLSLIPVLLIWISVTFVYVFMPNTSVKFSCALLPGILAGTLLLVIQKVYIETQFLVNSYGAIYGSFAALPLFLVWVQASWTVVLLGAELSFAYQNVTTYEFEPDCLRISRKFRELLTLRITHFIVKRFAEGETPASDSTISKELEIPVRLVRQILTELVGARVLCETRTPEDETTRYCPALDINRLTIAYVLSTLDSVGQEGIPVAEDEAFEKLKGGVASLASAMESSDGNMLLKDI